MTFLDRLAEQFNTDVDTLKKMIDNNYQKYQDDLKERTRLKVRVAQRLRELERRYDSE